MLNSKERKVNVAIAAFRNDLQIRFKKNLQMSTYKYNWLLRGSCESIQLQYSALIKYDRL